MATDLPLHRLDKTNLTQKQGSPPVQLTETPHRCLGSSRPQPTPPTKRTRHPPTSFQQNEPDTSLTYPIDNPSRDSPMPRTLTLAIILTLTPPSWPPTTPQPPNSTESSSTTTSPAPTRSKSPTSTATKSPTSSPSAAPPSPGTKTRPGRNASSPTNPPPPASSPAPPAISTATAAPRSPSPTNSR